MMIRPNNTFRKGVTFVHYISGNKYIITGNEDKQLYITGMYSSPKTGCWYDKAVIQEYIDKGFWIPSYENKRKY